MAGGERERDLLRETLIREGGGEGDAALPLAAGVPKKRAPRFRIRIRSIHKIRLDLYKTSSE